MRRFALILLVLGLTACGVQRPLVKPQDIPAYEEAQRQKREKVAREQAAQQQQDAADAAARTMIEDAQ